MDKFIITIDSSCDISYSYCEENDVYPLLMKYNIEDQIFQDTMEEEDIKMFYDKMRNGAVPKTTQINSSEYIKFWVPLLKHNLPIIHLSLSSGLSGTYQSGVNAIELIKEEYPNAKIYIIDTLMASGGICLPLFKLIEMRNNGIDYEETYQWVENNKLHVNTYYTTPEMVYLQRGGRVKKITSVLAGILKINPILKVNNEGHLVTHQTVTGSKKAMKRIVELVVNSFEREKNDYIVISHSDCIDRAHELGAMLKEKLNIDKIIYTTIGSTIGAHTGPGLIAVFYYGLKR